MAVDVGKAGDQRRAVELLELVKVRGVDDAGDDLAGVVGLAQVRGHDAQQLLRIHQWILDRRALPRQRGTRRQRADDVAHDQQGVGIVLGEMVGDARRTRVQLAAAQLLGGDLLAGGRFDQRWTAEEDRALVSHDHRLVAHRRNVGAAGGARAHDRGDLGDAPRRHRRLVEEDPPEVLAVGEDLVLAGEKGAAGVHEVDAGQPVLQRDLLRAQVLLDRHRVIGPALDGGIVGHDDAFAARHAADAGDDPGARRLVVIEAVSGQRRALQKRRAGVEQAIDTVARQQLAAPGVAFPRALSAPQRHALKLGAEVVDERQVGRLI